MTPDREYLRRSLLPSLLEALALNLHAHERVQLFEVARVYLPHAGNVLPDEPRHLAIAMAGQREAMSWLTKDAPMMDFFDLKGVIETLLARLQITDRVDFVALTDDPRFHPGRAAVLKVRHPQRAPHSNGQVSDGQVLGVLGELHPDVRERLDLKSSRALAAELDLETLITLAQPVQYRPISRFPATLQDLAVIVNVDMPAERVAVAIRKYAGANLESLTLFDVYEGPQIGTGRRSLAYRLVFRSMERTLTDEDVNKIRVKIVRGLERDVGAILRDK